MPNPLDGLRKATSIGPSTAPTDRPYGSGQGEMKGEMPLGPGGGIMGGPGGAASPAIEGLKDLYHTIRGTGEEMYQNAPALGRLAESPVVSRTMKSMDQEGPAKYLTALAQHLKDSGEEGMTLSHHLIEDLFPIMFGK